MMLLWNFCSETSILSGIASNWSSGISEDDFLKKSLWVLSKFEADSLKWSYGSKCTEIITERRHYVEGSPHKYFLVAALVKNLFWLRHLSSGTSVIHGSWCWITRKLTCVSNNPIWFLFHACYSSKIKGRCDRG